MCKAFSCLISKKKKVYWKTGLDSHDELVEKFKSKDKQLTDDKNPPNNTFARIEIVPKDGNYLNPKQDWKYIIEERVKPKWLDKSYEKPCRVVFKKWQKQVYSRLKLKEILHPINPLKIKPPKISTRHLKLLLKWIAVGGTVGDTVWGTVRDTVGGTVWGTVRDTVGGTVWGTVRDTVGGTVWGTVRDTVGGTVWGTVYSYYGSLFKGIKKWKYCEKVKVKGYPFKSVVKLWKMGLVACYDGTYWYLCGGTKGKILYKGTVEDIKKAIKKGQV